jgi:hypothetical protein
MGSKPRPPRSFGLRNWKEGEVRIKAEIVSPSGMVAKTELFHLSNEAGIAATVLLGRLGARLPVTLTYSDPKTGEKKELKA